MEPPFFDAGSSRCAGDDSTLDTLDCNLQVRYDGGAIVPDERNEECGCDDVTSATIGPCRTNFALRD